MKKTILSVFVALFLTGTPAQAQLQEVLGKLTKKFPSASRIITKPVGVSQQQLKRALTRAAVPNATFVHANAEKALIPLRERHPHMRYFRVPGTAFLIEEKHFGKKQLWGVSATHYSYQKPAIPKNRFSHVPVTFSAQGNENANDVSIFPIPEELTNTFKPLTLASHSPQVGEDLYSLSFFDKQFQITPHRKVLEVTPQRIIVSGQIDREICREGECGSPLINQKGEVVGMIVGVSYSKQIGYALPVENIHDILTALHQQGWLYKPVLINGREIMLLNINEAITKVTLTRNDNTRSTRFVYHNEKDLDLAHLETFMDFSQATEITLVIEKAPFSSEQTDRQRHVRHVVYDLQTGQTHIFPID